MNLKTLNNDQLVALTKTKTFEEKKLTLEVISLLKEIDSRKFYLELGFSSLFDFAVKELKYEEGAALRRISAARLIRDIPVVEDKIKEGKLTLTNISQAQSFFRKEQKLTNQKLTITQKTQVLSLLENKSSREVQKTLIELSPNQIELKESQKIISKDLIEYKIVISDKLSAKLQKLKSLLSHTNPNMTQSELLEKLADMALNKLDPEMKAVGKAKVHLKNSTHASIQKENLPLAPVVKKEAASRYIPSTIKQEVYMRDKGCCAIRSLKPIKDALRGIYFNTTTSNHFLMAGGPRLVT